MADKPRVIVLGGCGFLGRHLVTYLVKNNLVSKILVADKVLYQIAGMSKAELAIYGNENLVAFKQADLKNPDSVAKVFDHDGGNYRYVFNLAAATKYSQGREVYEANIIEVSRACAAEAAKRKVARYIEVSTAQVYDAGKKPSNESSSLNPWTGVAKASLEAEEIVRKTPGLNYVVVRPATCYGTGDILGLTPRLICGSIYGQTKKTMESLYSKSLRLNTVHADDVAKALWFLTNHGDNGSTWNLADKNDTDQGKINKLLEEIFGIKTDFVNMLKMKAASAMGTKFLAGFANDMHLKPFSDACKKFGIHDTPLTPYLDEELILDNPLSVDGSAIEALGFKYDHPEVTANSLREVLNDYVEKGYFPKQMLNPN